LRIAAAIALVADHGWLLQFISRLRQMTKDKTVVVLPAFETAPQREHDR